MTSYGSVSLPRRTLFHVISQSVRLVQLYLMTSSVAWSIQYLIIWQQWQVAMTTINVVDQNLPEKNHIHLNHDRWRPSQCSNWTPPSYKWEASPLAPIHLIPYKRTAVIWQQDLVWGSGFNFKHTDLNNPRKYKDWHAQYVLLLSVISTKTPLCWQVRTVHKMREIHCGWEAILAYLLHTNWHRTTCLYTSPAKMTFIKLQVQRLQKAVS